MTIYPTSQTDGSSPGIAEFDWLPAEEVSPARLPASLTAPNRVLVVDDEPTIRLALRHCLEAEGYEVAEASDGQQAIEALRKGDFQLMLLDLAMPTLDGLSTLRLMRSMIHRPKIIILTAHGSISAAMLAHRLGVSVFLEKPFSPQVLRDAVSSVLDRPEPGHNFNIHYPDDYDDWEEDQSPDNYFG